MTWLFWFIVKWFIFFAAFLFLNGLRKVWKNPRFTVITIDKYPAKHWKYTDAEGVRINVHRQEYLPPFRKLNEVWIKYDHEVEWTRVPDGKELDSYTSSKLNNQIEMIELDKIHTEKLCN